MNAVGVGGSNRVAVPFNGGFAHRLTILPLSFIGLGKRPIAECSVRSDCAKIVASGYFLITTNWSHSNALARMSI